MFNSHIDGETTVLPPIDPLVPYFGAMADYFGMSRSTAQQLVKRGTAKTIKVGRQVLVRRSEIVRLQAAYEADMAVAA